MGPHDDPSGWASLWMETGQSAKALADVLAARVQRERRRMVWTAVAQTLVSLVVLLVVGREALEHPDPYHIVWASGVAILVSAGWVFLLVNRRGVWAPYGESTRSFVTLVAERCRRRLRVVHVVTALAVIHLFFNAWLAWWGLRLRPGVPPHPADVATYIGAVVLLAAVIGWAIAYRRHIRRELAQVHEIARHID